MAKIEILQKDFEFLKELQIVLNSQPNDGSADPVFWGVEETVEECRGGDGEYGGEPYITFDDGKMSVEEAIKDIEDAFENEPEEYDDDIRAQWEEVDKSCTEDVCEFMTGMLHWEGIYGVVYVENVKRVTPYTGAFITKRACKEYIRKYGYNHNDPHTYAMTAHRNKEYETLIRILKTMRFEQ